MFGKLFRLGDAIAGEGGVGCDAGGRRNVGVVGAGIGVDYPIGAKLLLVSNVSVAVLVPPLMAARLWPKLCCEERGDLRHGG